MNSQAARLPRSSVQCKTAYLPIQLMADTTSPIPSFGKTSTKMLLHPCAPNMTYCSMAVQFHDLTSIAQYLVFIFNTAINTIYTYRLM